MRNNDLKTIKSTLVYIPTNDYLSDPLFSLVVPNLKEYHNVYLYTKEKTDFVGAIDPERKRKMDSVFDEYVDVPDLVVKYPGGYLVGIKYLPFIFSRKLIEKALQLRSAADNIASALDRLKPIAVVIPSDMSFSARVARKWCKREKVPFIVIQPSFFDIGRVSHGIKHMLYRVFFEVCMGVPLMRRQENWGCEYTDTNLVLWGRYFMEKYGKDQKKMIHISGSPIYDKYFQENHSVDHNELKKKLGIPLSVPVVVICTEGIGWYAKHENDRLNEIYKEAILKKKNCFFVVKPHPSDDLNAYKSLFSEMNNCIVINDIKLPDLFAVATCQISVFSVTSLEAVASGIPIILVNPDNSIKYADFFNNQIELKAVNASELDRCIEQCMEPEYLKEFAVKRKEYLTNMIGLPDGNASSRMADIIKQLTDRQPAVMRNGKDVVIICQGPADVQYVLELYEQHKGISDIYIYVMQVESIYKYLSSLKLDIKKLEYIESSYWYLSLRSPFSVMRAYKSISRLFKEQYAHHKNASVYMFSCMYDWVTASIAKKMLKENTVSIIDHYNYTLKINSGDKGSLVDYYRCKMLGLIAGVKTENRMVQNTAVFYFNPRKHSINVITLTPSTDTMTKYVPFVSVSNGDNVLFYETDQAGGLQLNVYSKRLVDVISKIKSHGYNIYIKPHPRMKHTKILNDSGVDILPAYVPGEFLPFDRFKYVFGIESVAPAKIAAAKGVTTYSLIGLFAGDRPEINMHFKEYLASQSLGRIKFIDSDMELSELLSQKGEK